MHKLIQITVVLLLITQLAAAQERQIKLLNPDGTPAADAKVIAINTIGAAMPMVDTNLELLPIDLRGKQADGTSMMKVENDNGTVSLSDDAKAIVACNDNGFVFLPADADGETAQLRPWANVKIDTSSIPETMKEKLWLRISWSNNFCGMYPGNGIIDGLGFPTAKKHPSPDWRFDPFVSWRRNVKVSENTEVFKVPPGEVSVLLTDIDPGKAQSGLGSNHSVFAKTTSNKTTEIAFPKFGSFRGTLVVTNKLGLPDWGQSRKTRVSVLSTTNRSPADLELQRRFANIETPFVTNINGVPRVEPSAQNWNDYAEFLSTDAGFDVRISGIRSTATEVEANGSFLVSLVPVGEYTLTRLTPSGQLISPTEEVQLVFTVEQIFQSGDEERTPLKVTVKENECLDLGNLDAAALMTSQTVTYSPLPDPKPRPGTIVTVDQNVMRNGKTESQIAHVITEDGSLRVATPEDFEKAAAAGIPFINSNPRIIQPGEVIGVAANTYTTPEINTLFGEKDLHTTATPHNTSDAATGIIEQWLKTADKDADREQLKVLLQKHLESEFDANQKSRQAEIERLQQLLGKSKEWLDQRQQRRDEIIKKRLDELLQQQESQKAEASGKR